MCPCHNSGLTSTPQTTYIPLVYRKSPLRKYVIFEGFWAQLMKDFGIHLLALIIQIDEDSV
jgi:hypothetical protein